MKKNNRDAAQKRYWEDERRTADLLNVILFNGSDGVSAEKIHNISAEVSLETGRTGGKQSLSRLADGARLVSVGEEQFFLYLENQSYIDYAMPERGMALEAACYHEQRARLRKAHEDAKDLREGGEFLSGFRKGDCFTPVLCIVLYYGEENWDGACSLQELIRFPKGCPRLQQVVNDSRILVLDVKRFPETESLRTDLRETFTFIKYASDKEKLKKYIEANAEIFRSIHEDALEFMAYTTGTRELLKMKEAIRTEEGEYDVCKAITDMKEESRLEGIRIGVEIGEKRGERRGERRGEKRGRQKQESEMLYALIKKKLMRGKSLEQIADELEKDVSEVQTWMKKLSIT